MPPEEFVIPDQLKLETRFAFIQDETLRNNTVITFRYIIFLIQLQQKTKLPSSIIYSVYKDIIVQTATVVESCMHYSLKRLIDEGKIKSSEVMENEWKEEKCIILETLDNGNKQVCGITRHKTSTKLTKHTAFIDLNRACKRAGIYTDGAFEKVEELREARNKIHLAGLNKVDDIYTKEDVDKYFDHAKTIITCLETALTK